MNRVLDKIAKFRERDFDDIPASHVRTLICDEIETDAILDEKERASKELGSEKTPRKVDYYKAIPLKNGSVHTVKMPTQGTDSPLFWYDEIILELYERIEELEKGCQQHCALFDTQCGHNKNMCCTGVNKCYIVPLI